MRHEKERSKRSENTKTLKSSKWLIVCEGTKTEPNYFKQAIDEINKTIDNKYKLRVDIVGKGMNTTSLVKATELLAVVDKNNKQVVPYGKIFVVFDKDSFSSANFNQAVSTCINNGYIPLWSNQAIEFWFLLHFNYICSAIDRQQYAIKLNEYFRANGLNYQYKKNDTSIYNKLCTYGSLDVAMKNAKKISAEHEFDKPSAALSCTHVYKFFDEVEDRLNELNN
mgnify:CR=1 FL=1